MFRECITNSICPFIIRDVNKARYINALSTAQNKSDYAKIVNYFMEEQHWYKEKVVESLI